MALSVDQWQMYLESEAFALPAGLELVAFDVEPSPGWGFDVLLLVATDPELQPSMHCDASIGRSYLINFPRGVAPSTTRSYFRAVASRENEFHARTYSLFTSYQM